jgi:SAM-dependent methyltransferase
LQFCLSVLPAESIQQKSVLEVGALDVNGSVRGPIKDRGPSQYVGIDIKAGPGVDMVCDGGALLDRFGPESFDVVIATEVLEHVRDWRAVVHNMKGVLRPGGVIVVTTRSPGFPFHGFPFDYWRYRVADMRQIFGDMLIEDLEDDPQSPGVFIKARKPESFEERELNSYALYSMLAGRPALQVRDGDRVRYLVTHPQRIVTLLLPIRASDAIARLLPEMVKSRLR